MKVSLVCRKLTFLADTPKSAKPGKQTINQLINLHLFDGSIYIYIVRHITAFNFSNQFTEQSTSTMDS